MVFTVCAAGVVVAAYLLVTHQLRVDDERTARCTTLGGYVEDRTSLCRHRRTDEVLATWSELEHERR